MTTVPKIKEALNFMKKYSFEVPFIANYRREYVEPELTVRDLWKVLRCDEKVCSIFVEPFLNLGGYDQRRNKRKGLRGRGVISPMIDS